jgi:hypothetical protein
MSDNDFNELAGRIQGLADFVLHLTSMLEMSNVIDGPYLTEKLHCFADGRQGVGDHLSATKRTLHELADHLDEARKNRQLRSQ